MPLRRWPLLLPGLLLALALGLAGMWIAQLPALASWQLSALTVAIVLGMLVGNLGGERLPAALAPGIHVSQRQLLRAGCYIDELQGDAIDTIAKAAPLHDIGKVGIPDEILKKPGKLTPEEYEIMKGHARIGAEAIAEAIRRVSQTPTLAASDHDALGFLRTWQDIAGCHHEKWDGSGYPQGLAGEAIPLSARLMALADVFDALTCRRVYKAAMPYPEVVRIIREGRGRHFDPAVVDAFFAIESEFLDISLRYADAR